MKNLTLSLLPAPVLFDQAQVTLVEEGQPQQHHMLSATVLKGGWNGNVRFNYFAEVAGEGFTPGFKQVWGGKWLNRCISCLHVQQWLDALWRWIEHL